jgi:splicing factor 45
MANQNQKPQGLPNPYGSLPNPYALPAAAEAAPVKFTEEQAKPEEKKSTGT